MSNLVRQYVDVVGGLARHEPVSVCLPNGTIVRGVPELIEVDGKPMMQVFVSVDGANGEVQAQVRMSPETYEKNLEKARNLTPRLAAMQERQALMLNRRSGED